MTSSVYKFTTIGLAAILVAFYVLVTTPPATWFEPTNNQPNHLENIPDGWSAKTWTNGEEEAVYVTSYERCKLSIAKEGLGRNLTDVTWRTVCSNEYAGTIHANEDGEEHRFVTEPADFDFEQEQIDECYMNIMYATFQPDGGEGLFIDAQCWWHDEDAPE